jgi:hypothetical protein
MPSNRKRRKLGREFIGVSKADSDERIKSQIFDLKLLFTRQ